MKLSDFGTHRRAQAFACGCVVRDCGWEGGFAPRARSYSVASSAGGLIDQVLIEIVLPA